VLLQSLLRSWEHDRAAWIASLAISLAVYVAIAAAVPIVLTRLPHDYFARPPRRRRAVVVVARTLLGVAVVAAGVAMLFLPGPGIVTMLLGLTIMGGDLAARAARWLVGRPRVLDAINAIRRKRGRAPLVVPPRDPS
jgi:hypothetical protein